MLLEIKRLLSLFTKIGQKEFHNTCSLFTTLSNTSVRQKMLGKLYINFTRQNVHPIKNVNIIACPSGNAQVHPFTPEYLLQQGWCIGIRYQNNNSFTFDLSFLNHFKFCCSFHWLPWKPLPQQSQHRGSRSLQFVGIVRTGSWEWSSMLCTERKRKRA